MHQKVRENMLVGFECSRLKLMKRADVDLASDVI